MSCTVWYFKDHPDLRCHSSFLRDYTAISLSPDFLPLYHEVCQQISVAPRLLVLSSWQLGVHSPGEACGIMSETSGA